MIVPGCSFCSPTDPVVTDGLESAKIEVSLNINYLFIKRQLTDRSIAVIPNVFFFFCFFFWWEYFIMKTS